MSPNQYVLSLTLTLKPFERPEEGAAWDRLREQFYVFLDEAAADPLLHPIAEKLTPPKYCVQATRPTGFPQRILSLPDGTPVRFSRSGLTIIDQVSEHAEMRGEVAGHWRDPGHDRRRRSVDWTSFVGALTLGVEGETRTSPRHQGAPL